MQALISIGYKGIAIPGLEAMFDPRRGVVVNAHGKVDDSRDGMGSLFVSGWLKRGPSGIIGTNIADAKDTVASIMNDLDHQAVKETEASLDSLLEDRQVKLVDWSSYERIDAVETDDKRKRSANQPREKIPNIDGLLQAAFVS